jgi:hypothetical protein
LRAVTVIVSDGHRLCSRFDAVTGHLLAHEIEGDALRSQAVDAEQPFGAKVPPLERGRMDVAYRPPADLELGNDHGLDLGSPRSC